MIVRIGKVTNIYPKEGKVKVKYDDLGCASAKLPMLTYNDEYKMLSEGDTVLVVHMQNSGSKGFVLGTFWSKTKLPGSKHRYRKALCDNVTVEADGDGNIEINSKKQVLAADKVTFKCSGDTLTVPMELLISLIRGLMGAQG